MFGALWPDDQPPRFRLSEKTPPIVREVFESKGWREWQEGEPEPELTWRSGPFTLSDYEAAGPFALLNHFPRTAGITRKDNLERNMRRMAAVHGAVYSFTPRTFLLPSEYARFVEASSAQPGACWICKPVDASQGQHIFIIRDASEISSEYYAAQDEDGAEGPTGGRAINGDVGFRYTLKALRARLHRAPAPCVAFSRPHIAQRYVDRPALIGARKFDLRLYALVASFSPLRAYLYSDAVVRLATAPYDLASLDDAFSHLTNASINKHSSSDCKRALSQLGPADGAGAQLARRPELRRRIAELVVLTLLPIAATVPDNGGCFELLGYDVLLDHAGKPWLLEVNACPALSAHGPEDTHVKRGMLASLLDVLLATKLRRAQPADAPQRKPRHGQPHQGRGCSGTPAAARPASAVQAGAGPAGSRTPGGERRSSLSGSTGGRGAAGARGGAPSAGAAKPPLPRRVSSAGASRQRPRDDCGGAPSAAALAPAEEASIGGWELIFPFDEKTRRLARALGGREGEVVAHIRAASARQDGAAAAAPAAAAGVAAAAGGTAAGASDGRQATVQLTPARCSSASRARQPAAGRTSAAGHGRPPSQAQRARPTSAAACISHRGTPYKRRDE